jgi:hypothetical protein
MIRARVCMIAGLTGIAAMMSANASAQDCPEWLRWACSNSGSSNPAREVAPRERQRARTPTAASSQMDPITKQVRAAPEGATPQQTKRWETTHAVKAARNTGSSDSSGDQHPARYGHDGVMNDQEREALFEEFLAWQKARRLDGDTNSDPSGDQRSVVMNDQEKEALFQEFSAWQKARRLNADANR